MWNGPTSPWARSPMLDGGHHGAAASARDCGGIADGAGAQYRTYRRSRLWKVHPLGSNGPISEIEATLAPSAKAMLDDMMWWAKPPWLPVPRTLPEPSPKAGTGRPRSVLPTAGRRSGGRIVLGAAGGGQEGGLRGLGLDPPVEHSGLTARGVIASTSESMAARSVAVWSDKGSDRSH